MFRTLKLGDDVYHLRRDVYGTIVDIFHIEDVCHLGRTTVHPFVVIAIYCGIGKGTRIACPYEALTLTEEMN